MPEVRWEPNVTNIVYGELIEESIFSARAIYQDADGDDYSPVGTYTYTYSGTASGTLTTGLKLNAGSYTLTVTFDPTDGALGANITSNVSFEVKRDEFIYLLSKSYILIGNSSCGILEASSFKLPVINIGTRQRGGLQPQNVLNAKNSSSEIIKAIKYVLKNKSYIKKVKKCKNPYGDGKSSDRIVNILKNIKIDHKLLDKINTY